MLTTPASKLKRFDVTSLGETMLRLSVPSGQRLEAARQFAVHVAGSESNVCAALAGLGRRCGWVSRLPDNALGRLVLRQCGAAGLDTSAVGLSDTSRLGLYFAELAEEPRPTQVLYDRASSAAASMSVETVDWDYLLSTRLLHLTGITPALSDSCHALVGEVIRRARAAGIPVSFDVNYRSRLWRPDRAATVLRPLLGEVDLLFCKEADAAALFGYVGAEHNVLIGLRSLTRARHIVLTRGERGAAALDGDSFIQQSAIPARVVDRLGAGDAFAAGVIDGWLDGSLAAGLSRGVTLAALALSQDGDMLISSRAEMLAIAGSSRGAIDR